MAYEVEIPDGIEVALKGNEISVKGPKGELRRNVSMRNIRHSMEKGVLKLSSENGKKAMLGTVTAHIKNMVHGVKEGFEYKLKICYAHFPINVSIAGNKVIIKNFIGEKKDREAKIIPGVKVDIKGQDITVSGTSIEEVGQTAANIELATRVTGRDVRVFSDGIYITKKPSHKGE